MPALRDSKRERVARAVAPSHVTGVFSPDRSARDPRGRGSVGAGLVLDAPVTATARFVPGRRRILTVRWGRRTDLPISREVASRLSAGRVGRISVELDHVLPIGQGFGASAAGATATALAVSGLWSDATAPALEAAHLADLFGEGGLGGVAAILGGGLEVRQRAGLPPRGRVTHRPLTASIIVSVVGAPMDSPPLLGDPEFLDRVRAAARPGLTRLGARPSLARFLEEAEAFTDTLRLGSRRLRESIAALRAAGAPTVQAMFGESLFSVPPTPRTRRLVLRELTRRRLPAVELGAASQGAHRLPAG